MSSWAEVMDSHVTAGLSVRAEEDDAVAMAAYMREQFAFHGVKKPGRVEVWRAARDAAREQAGRPTHDDVVAYADHAWTHAQREHHYLGAEALAANHRLLGPDDLGLLERLIVTNAWWDTVDILAPKVVGPIARRAPEAVAPVRDRWAASSDRWLVRSAIIHQLFAKADTDVDRLARYCTANADDPEFFVRKAIGWALRQYSYVDAAWVERFVESTSLSPLSEREALKAIRRDAGR